MIIKEVHLRNFRNYIDQVIKFDDGLNIIVGKNSQGKTNILESLVLLSTTRSFRDVDDYEMVRHGESFGDVEGVFFDDSLNRLKVIISNKGNTLMLNSSIFNRTSDFIGLLNVVIFDPSNISFFDESPGFRRRAIDIEIAKVDKRYVLALNAYNKLLKERNTYLKNDNADIAYLKALEQQMIDYELLVIDRRNKLCECLNDGFSSLFNKLSNSNDNIRIEYNSCVAIDDKLKQNLEDMYERSRNKDIFYKLTNNGIHRDDFVFYFNEHKIETIASQGQKRLTIIVFKLKLIDYIYKITKKKPVLLLDDILSELDNEKQYLLLKNIPRDIQTIITTTNISKTLNNLKFKVINIEKGTVKGRVNNE